MPSNPAAQACRAIPMKSPTKGRLARAPGTQACSPLHKPVLPIALWHYLEDGVIPEGARLIASEI